MFSVLTRFLGFIYKIYLGRIMSTTELGIYNVTFSIFMVLITIVASSIPLTISKITSQNNINNKTYQTNYSVTSSIILTTGISIILTILLLLSKPIITVIIGSELAYQILISMAPAIIFSALYSQIRGYLWGLENYFSVSIVEFIEQLLRIGLCIIFIITNLFSSPVIAVGWALSLACGISTLYGFYLYFKSGGKLKFKKGYFKEIINSSLPLTGVRLFGSILQPIVSIILPLILVNFGMTRDIALGELGIIMGMSMPLLTIPSTIIASLCMVLVPRISGYDKSKPHRLRVQIENYLQFTLICSSIFIPIFMVLGLPICNFVFNNSQAGIYLSYSSWIIIPMGISQISSSILNALNQEQKSFIYYIISSIFMIITIVILPKFIQILAMTYGLGISNIILSYLNLRKLKKLIGYEPKIINKLLTQLAIILPVILITKLSYNWISTITGNFTSILSCSFICIVSHVMLLFAFNVLKPKSFINFVNKNLKHKNI